MGYYTKLKLNVQLNDKAPFDVLEKLANTTMYKHLTGREYPTVSLVADTPNLPIEHDFGKTHRWDLIFNQHTTRFNKERKTLKIKCEIKAYEEDYEKLIDWLKPYIVSGSARIKGEEDDGWTKSIVITKNNVK